jgi:hypothetical protein
MRLFVIAVGLMMVFLAALPAEAQGPVTPPPPPQPTIDPVTVAQQNAAELTANAQQAQANASAAAYAAQQAQANAAAAQQRAADATQQAEAAQQKATALESQQAAQLASDANAKANEAAQLAAVSQKNAEDSATAARSNAARAAQATQAADDYAVKFYTQAAQIEKLKRTASDLSDQVTTFQLIALLFAGAFLISLAVVVIVIALRRKGFTQTFSSDVNGAIVIPFGRR